jgi:hypothetical protein
MNNATKTVTATGNLARGMISDGLEVNAEIADEEPSYAPKGLDAALLKVVRKYGAVAVLEALHDAALGAAEVHEDCDDRDEPDYGVVSCRLQVFCRKLEAATRTLR